MWYIHNQMAQNGGTEEENAAAVDVLRVQLGIKTVDKFLKHLKLNDHSVVPCAYRGRNGQGQAGNAIRLHNFSDAFAAAFASVPVPMPRPPPPPVPCFYVHHGDGPTPPGERQHGNHNSRR